MRKLYDRMLLCVRRRLPGAAIGLRGHFATAATSTPVKPFDDIPGPRGPFGLGNLYQYVSGIGNYSFDAIHHAGEDKYNRYGTIVKETMVPGRDVLWLYDPEDIGTVLGDRTPGLYPSRRSHTALAKYRLERPNACRTAGLIPTNGLEWWKIRSELQKGLSSPQCVKNFLPLTDQVTKEFIESIKPTEDVNNVPDFMPAIARHSLELVCLLAFDVRMDCFSPEQMHPDSLSSRLMAASEETNSSILPTDQGLQLWRFFETPLYRRMRKAQEFMDNVAIELVQQKMLEGKESQQQLVNRPPGYKSLIEEYLCNPKLELSDITTMATDLLLAGVHTTSYTSAFILYHVALNKDAQDKLFAEAKKVLPDPHKGELSTAALATELSYSRAVLKESQRLNPVSVGVGRIVERDMVLSGYHVPKGTQVVTQNMVSCRQERYFKNPRQFLPERWLRGSKENVNPYLVMPFGHGMRACIARRFAEQKMLVFLTRLIRSYEISWAGGIPMDVKTNLINQPDQPVKIVLKARDS